MIDSETIRNKGHQGPGNQVGFREHQKFPLLVILPVPTPVALRSRAQITLRFNFPQKSQLYIAGAEFFRQNYGALIHKL